ncbi:MAG: GNAT family N-acetyltransferase [Cyclobacteriaceae bacterium]
MRIELDDLSRAQVQALLREHLSNMYELSPPENVFALDLTRLRAPDVTFWTVWEGEALLGCGALKELTLQHGEVKSMRTPANLRRRGAGRAVLAHLIGVAKQRGYRTLSLETGSHPAFLPAQKLYQQFGFTFGGPFGNYQADPHGAVGYLALERYLADHPAQKGIFLETAHPVKFPDAVETATGHAIEMPASIRSLMVEKKHSILLAADYNKLKEYLLR